jgi:hypothetical protein
MRQDRFTNRIRSIKKSAVIITPDGHFGDGRYRKDEQYRCAMMAKMGAIVVGYDLFAWGESLLQFPEETHRNSIASTVQLLTGIRLLDYLSTVKNADMSRVGVTGGSGGGSHTMFLSAIDDRVESFSSGCNGFVSLFRWLSMRKRTRNSLMWKRNQQCRNFGDDGAKATIDCF